MNQSPQVISEKQKAIKEQRSFNIKIGAMILKLAKLDNANAVQALNECAKNTTRLKDREMFENLICNLKKNPSLC